MSDKCRSSIEGLGYEVLPLLPSDSLAPPVASHPDMICHRLDTGRWVFERSAYEKNRDMLEGLKLDILVAKSGVGRDYPYDIAFNAARVRDKLICNPPYLLPEIREYAVRTGLKIVPTRQGYARCSTCVAGDGIITSDISIYRAATGEGIDCLLISSGYIRLDGYSTGFIGGASGMIGENTLVLTGDIRLHPDYFAIKDFTNRKGIDIICLTDEIMYDYGSLLFL